MMTKEESKQNGDDIIRATSKLGDLLGAKGNADTALPLAEQCFKAIRAIIRKKCGVGAA